MTENTNRSGENLVIVFAKNADTSEVKTRLAESIGRDAARKVYQSLLKGTLDILWDLDFDVCISWFGGVPGNAQDYFQHRIQADGDLGEKMHYEIRAALNDGYKRVVVIGTDCPYIQAEHIGLAFESLTKYDVVIGPAVDGGYYLLGCRDDYPRIFQKIEWGTKKVYAQTVQVLHDLNLSYYRLEYLEDIDDEETLRNWERKSKFE